VEGVFIHRHFHFAVGLTARNFTIICVFTYTLSPLVPAPNLDGGSVKGMTKYLKQFLALLGGLILLPHRSIPELSLSLYFEQDRHPAVNKETLST